MAAVTPQVSVFKERRDPMVDYSGYRARNTRRVFRAPSSFHRFFCGWSAPGRHFRGGMLLLSDGFG